MKDKYFFHHLNSRFFKISGKDSKAFIQNLITNDIQKCSNGSIIYSCLLTPQGKFLADFFIFNINENYFFETNEKFYENLISKLKIYKLRSDIQIEEVNNFYSYSIFNIDYEYDYTIQLNDPRNSNLGKKLILNNKIKISDNNIETISEIEYHEILIANTTPYSPFDILENKSLLLENNFDNLNAIDWDKGCYVGQEITARMKYRGLLKKKLYPLRLKVGSVLAGDELIINNKKIGTIISIANSNIFASLNINFINELKKNNKILTINDSLTFDFLN
tara:strand:+ start:4101 stop:4931 length:831 start_codon:yes stop_codon:yes gene_type:complete